MPDKLLSLEVSQHCTIINNWAKVLGEYLLQATQLLNSKENERGENKKEKKNKNTEWAQFNDSETWHIS